VCPVRQDAKKKTTEERRPVGGSANEHLRARLRQHLSVDTTDGILSNKCRHKCSSSVNLNNSTNVPDGEIENPENITLDIPRAGALHSYSFICRKHGNKKGYGYG